MHCANYHRINQLIMIQLAPPVSGGSGQYAKLCMVYEPNPGAGFEFENSVVGGSVPKEYVPAVVKGTENELLNGIRMGFPVVDVKASLKERWLSFMPLHTVPLLEFSTIYITLIVRIVNSTACLYMWVPILSFVGNSVYINSKCM